MQNILDIEYKLEEQAKSEYMAANRQLQEEEERLEGFRQRKRGYEDHGRELLCSQLDVDEIRSNEAAIERMDDMVKQQQLRREQAMRQLEQKAARLAELRQERKAQEKLRERAFDDFVHEENAKEGKEIDELVSYTYGRKRQEE
jgi:flagellar FliJ protein